MILLSQLIPDSQVVETTEVPVVKLSFLALESSKTSWVFDPRANKFKLNVDINGKML